MQAQDFFRGKVVVVTGAASGIGAALVSQLASQGARLMLADIDATALATVQSAAQAKGGECLSCVTDTGDEAALYELARKTQAALGGTDILINNAGVALVAPVSGMTTADAQWIMNINFWGVVHGCRAFLPALQAQPTGVIVNISSIFAMISVPTQSMYNASKAAVRAFSDSLRQELRGSGVRVLCVHPGGIATNIVNAARIVDSSLVADSDAQLRRKFNQEVRTSPQEAAQAILAAIAHGKTRLLIGPDAKLLDLLYRLAPARASGWVTAMGRRMRAKSR